MANRKPEIRKGLQVIAYRDTNAWLAWLQKNFAQEDGIWVKLAKKATGIQSITYEEMREGAIAYGWIDGLKNTYDDEYYLIKVTPRRAKSKWSKINRNIAEALIKAKEMKPSGLEQVNAAKSDGRWAAAYDSPSKLPVPDKLQKFLDRNKRAKVTFESLNSRQRAMLLYRIHDAKRAETKEKWLNVAIEMLRKGEVP